MQGAKIIRNALLIVMGGLAIQACVSSDYALKGEELSSVIAGNTVYGVNSSGTEFIQIFSYDGTLLSGPANKRDSAGKWVPFETGQWKIVDGRLCNTYSKPAPRDGGCDRFFNRADGQYVYTTPSGRQGQIRKVVSGRAE
jgi:hypothetical protein